MFFRYLLIAFLWCTPLHLFSTTDTPSNTQDMQTQEPSPIAASAIDLDELDDTMNRLIDIGGTIPEDTQITLPFWKSWMMKAGDLMYRTYQVSVDTVQSLCTQCKKLVTGPSDEDTPEQS